jgi:hypothetical protein
VLEDLEVNPDGKVTMSQLAELFKTTSGSTSEIIHLFANSCKGFTNNAKKWIQKYGSLLFR